MNAFSLSSAYDHMAEIDYTLAYVKFLSSRCGCYLEECHLSRLIAVPLKLVVDWYGPGVNEDPGVLELEETATIFQ